MTTSELSRALAAQRAAYVPDQVPPFSELVRRKRRQDLPRRAAVVAAAAAAVAAAAALLPDLVDRPDIAISQAGPPAPAPEPDEQRLRETFGALTAPVLFDSVDRLQAGDAGIGDQPRKQSHGLTATTRDRQLVVSWSVLAPALTDAEARAVAGSVRGDSGLEQGVLIETGADRAGPVRSVAYRFDDGSFIRVWAWSDDGGVATVTSGAGATTGDAQAAQLERAARALLAGG